MRILRRYQCLDCGRRYRKTLEVSADAHTALVDPPCPSCLHQAAATPARIAAPAISTTKSRAVDEAWRIAQQDYGLTNMRDNTREGETAILEPPSLPPENQAQPGFLWGGASSSQTLPMPGMANLLGNARQAAAAANLEGRNPMRLLHRTRPRLIPIPVNKRG